MLQKAKKHPKLMGLLVLVGIAIVVYFNRKKILNWFASQDKGSIASKEENSSAPNMTVVTNNSINPYEVLKTGSNGETVKAMQKALNKSLSHAKARGKYSGLSPLIVDGKFGTNTLERLKVLTGQRIMTGMSLHSYETKYKQY